MDIVSQSGAQQEIEFTLGVQMKCGEVKAQGMEKQWEHKSTTSRAQGVKKKKVWYANPGGGQHEIQRLAGATVLPRRQCLRQRGNRAELPHLSLLLFSGSTREFEYCSLQGSARLGSLCRQSEAGRQGPS